LEAALERSGQPVKRGTMAHEHHVYTLLADCAAQRRDAAALARYAGRAEELARQDGHPLYQAIAYRTGAVASRLAGRLSEAEGQLAQAIALFSELGTTWQLGRSLFELGELNAEAGDGAAAQTAYGQALAAFERMKAKPDAARTQLALAGLG
jgi:hypothetical protein